MMKTLRHIMFLIVSGTALLAAGGGSFPVPPEIKSDKGYVTVTESTTVKADSPRIMILPHTELLVLDQDMNEFTILCRTNGTALCCKIPKYAKYMVLMRDSRDKNFISFRGAIEIETVPFALKKGEELPVIETGKNYYRVKVIRKGLRFTLKIPSGIPEIKFSRESEFAKFAALQKKKGLVFYEGKWLPEAEAESIRTMDAARKRERETAWRNLKKSAENGVVVLKNGLVLHGRLTANTYSQILFTSNGRDYMLGINDVASIPVTEAVARGKLDSAATSLNKARSLLKTDKGLAMYNAGQAVKFLKKMDSNSVVSVQAESLMKEATALIDSIDSSLAEDGKVIYRNTVFKKYVLDYHLHAGHILLRRRFWIKPDQLCDDCHGSGTIVCPVCNGNGRIEKDCPGCENGRITCPVCHGTGSRKCNYCGGKGYIYVKQPKTSVYASFGSYCPTYYPSYSGGTQIYSKGGYIFVQPTQYYGGPCYTGSSMSVGSTGGEAVKEVCPHCRGTGTLSCPKTVKCPKCHGVGYFIEICPECHGEKRVTCQACDGKGFTGEPQPDPPEPEKARKDEGVKDAAHSFFTPPVIVP